MLVDRVIPCICCDHERNDGDSVYYGMPQLRVTDVHPVLKTQLYEAFCPNCGRGGMFQYKSAYLALKAWNKLQKGLRQGCPFFVTDGNETENSAIDSPSENP